MNKVRKALNVMCEMFEDRNDIHNSKSLKDKLLNFDETIGKKDFNNNVTPVQISDTTYVIFVTMQKIKIGQINNEILNAKKNKDVTYCIVVFKDKALASTIKNIEHCAESEPKVALQIFYLDQLQANISRHDTNPKHSIISKDEAHKFLRQFMIKNTSQLPFITKSDPMVKYLFAKPNDFIKIERDGEPIIRVVSTQK